MPQTERINPKTGQKQYRGLFQYYTPDGKMHYNNTGWCDTKEQAKAEAAKLKKIKKEEISLSFQRRDKTLETAFESFIEEYGKKATRVRCIFYVYSKIYFSRTHKYCGRNMKIRIGCIRITEVI